MCVCVRARVCVCARHEAGDLQADVAARHKELAKAMPCWLKFFKAQNKKDGEAARAFLGSKASMPENS